jgi:hypothetical protein
MFWVDLVYIGEEGGTATVVVIRDGYQGRADVVGEYMCL